MLRTVVAMTETKSRVQTAQCFLSLGGARPPFCDKKSMQQKHAGCDKDNLDKQPLDPIRDTRHKQERWGDAKIIVRRRICHGHGTSNEEDSSARGKESPGIGTSPIMTILPNYWCDGLAQVSRGLSNENRGLNQFLNQATVDLRG